MAGNVDNNIEFRITEDDYLEALDPLNANLKKSRKQTKNKQIYGLWNNSESSESDDEFFTPRKKRSKYKKDYTAPVHFITSSSNDRDNNSDSNRDDNNNSNSNFKSKKNKEFSNSFRSKETRSLGNWEKHTTGFGSRMLEKMGYKEGQGLGEGGKGIVEPIKVVAKKGRQCLDVTEPKNKHKSQKFDDSFLFDDVEVYNQSEPEESQEKIPLWKKGSNFDINAEVPFSIEEIKKRSLRRKRLKMNTIIPETSSSTQNTKVINMTGPEYQEYENIEAYLKDNRKQTTEATNSESTEFLPELVQNMATLIDICEDRIVDTAQELSHDEDLIVHVKYEYSLLKEKTEKAEQDYKNMDSISKTFSMIEERYNSGLVTLDMCSEWLSTLISDYPIEYRKLELYRFAVPLAFPLIATEMDTWDPFDNRKNETLINIFSTWKTILDIREQFDVTDRKDCLPENATQNTYDLLLSVVWLPIFETHLNTISLRQFNVYIDLIESWSHLLTKWIKFRIEDKFLLPKLNEEVSTWEPTTDPMPVHHWIHPWWPIFGTKLDPLHAQIRFKLSVVLNQWHPSDESAYQVIRPWKNYFSESEMNAFLAVAICPKLAQLLNTIAFDNSELSQKQYSFFIHWEDVLSQSQILSLLCKHFFTNWHSYLESLINNSNNFQLASKCFQEWRSLLDKNFSSDQTVQTNINRALDIVNQNQFTNPIYSTAKHAKPTIFNPMEAIENSLSLKELLERIAQRNDLLFLPQLKQNKDGKTLYTFGKSAIYIEKNVIFKKQSNNLWNPISIDELVTKSK